MEILELKNVVSEILTKSQNKNLRLIKAHKACGFFY